MVPSTLHKIAIATRLSAGLFAGASLGLFAVVLIKVIDKRFPAVMPGLTALPVAALAFAILWNLCVVATTGRVNWYWHIVGDVLALVLLAVLGAIGFAHDNRYYLSNGQWAQYDEPGWLMAESIAGVFMLVSFILQLASTVLAFSGRQVNIKILFQVSRGKFSGDYEIQYAQGAIEKQKERNFETDRESFVSSDASYIEELSKGNGKKSSKK